MSFESLYRPLEEADAWLTGLFDGAPLPAVLVVAFVLGLRHASDPDPRGRDVARRCRR